MNQLFGLQHRKGVSLQAKRPFGPSAAVYSKYCFPFLPLFPLPLIFHRFAVVVGRGQDP